MRKQIGGSFRDPSGSVYLDDGVLYREVSLGYKGNYDLFLSSGLYEELASSGLLIPHLETNNAEEKVYKIIKPKAVPFISYPYEWCFSQLKEAALLTLKIQKLALRRGMSLKDCSAYNIQFIGPKPVFIDTLSFEKYVKNTPWVAYRQFCQHFIAPLALMGFVDVRLNQLLKSYIDGLPLDLADSLLPLSKKLNINLFLHIHLHAKAQKYGAGLRSLNNNGKSGNFSLSSFYGLIDSLESLVRRIKWNQGKTRWSSYYVKQESYSSEAMKHKKRIVDEFIEKTRPRIIWDLGANTGVFSRIASGKGIYTLSCDIDPVCVEKSYLASVENKEDNILSLLLDVSNLSPGIGWENRERASFVDRGPADLVIGLALIHHLAIANNLPLDKVSSFFSKICKVLIIEFVPKDDEMAGVLLAGRNDIFKNYTQECFETAFMGDFIIEQAVKINDSKRTLYLMRRKGG